MNTATTAADREDARALLASAGAHWHAAITSTTAPHYQAALDRIANLIADSRELAAVRERAAESLRWALAHLPENPPDGGDAYAWGLEAARATLSALTANASLELLRKRLDDALAEALREVTDRYERLDRRHALPDSGPNGSIARARAALASLDAGPVYCGVPLKYHNTLASIETPR